MILRCVCLSIFLCLAIQPNVNAEVTVVDQGYQNVMISFASIVRSENGKELILSIQELLQKTSDVLQTAIGIRIANVTFLLPSSWPVDTWEDINITSATAKQLRSKPDISIDATEFSPFGKKPVTLQHGGCGVGGHQITLPVDFVSSTVGYPKEKLLAREWLKYRYGVFEENGFAGDKLYPEYYRVPGSSEIRITECTNLKVTYTFKNPASGDECDMDLENHFGYCRTHPDEESAGNVTSSLMYYHKDLQNMEHICGKDNHTHHSTARNKQNALCDGKSVWDVIQSSEDFKTVEQEPSDPAPEDIEFSYILESKPRFVVVLEDSDKFKKMEKPLLFALRRFYFDLPPKNKLAIISYNSNASLVLPYTELASENRDDLGNIPTFSYYKPNVCSSCGLAKAVEVLFQNSEVEEGSILLITASPLENIPEIFEKVKNTRISLNILRLSKDETVDSSYEELEDLFDDYYYEPFNVSDELTTFNSVSRFLREPVPESNDKFEIKTVVSGSMSSTSAVTISPDPTASLFTLWMGAKIQSDGIECKVGDIDVPLTQVIATNDIASFNISPMEDDIICRVGSSEFDPILSEVMMATKEGNYFDLDVWIHDESTKEKQLPIIVYAKIYFSGYPVQEANAKMVVTSENNPDVIVRMLDNGRGDPDVTGNDGIYSGYFTDFVTKGSYQITVTIDDNEGKAKIGKLNPYLKSDTCCGSKIISDHVEAAPAFSREKHITYIAQNKQPEDGYPPSRIIDLEAYIFNVSDAVYLTWTAPGGGKAERYEVKWFQTRENAESHFETTGHHLNASGIIPGDTGNEEGLVIPVVDFEEDKTYYVTMRSWNEYNISSGTSNVVEFFIPKPGQEITGDEASSTPGGITDDESVNRARARKRTIEIVVGVLAGIVVLCILVYLGVYFFVQKPKRKEEKAKARKKAENGGGHRPSSAPGQTGLNSIPADVIIKHHNEVVEAKSLHKDPPIFNEESLDSFNSSPELPENSRRNNKVAQYAMVQKNPEGTAPNSSQQDPSKSPKRMTVV